MTIYQHIDGIAYLFAGRIHKTKETDTETEVGLGQEQGGQ